MITVMPQLRPYQADVINQTKVEWLKGSRNVMIVSATGSGKTVMFSELISEERGAVCAVAHRHELVSQMSMALARCGIRHRIIGSAALARDCRANHLDEFGVSYVDPNSAVAVASVDTLIGMDANDPWFASVRLWVMDECFIAGTMIGNTPIEKIKVGDIVDAFNEETGEIEPRRVVRLFRNPSPKHMVRVSAGHHVLHCTYGHPFFTRRGWVEAGRLTNKDEVLIYEMHPLRGSSGGTETAPTVRAEDQGENLLPEDVRLGASNGEFETASTNSKTRCELHDVWQSCGHVGAQILTVEEHGASVLQPDVLGCVPTSNSVRNDGGNQQGACVSPHAHQQPDAQRSHAGEGFGYVGGNQSSSENTGRKRAADDATRSGVICDIRGNGVHSAVSDTHVQTEGVGLPTVLQTGPGQPVADVGNRSGREHPQRPQASGREEGCTLEWFGVDSIEIYERTNYVGDELGSDDGYVYNFEVEGLHTYIANGVVVHNCHHVLKHNKWGAAVNMFPNARGLGVTAETERADGYGLGAQNDGVFHAMVVAPVMRDLINMGFLTDYRVFVPPSRLDRAALQQTVSKTTGEYSPKKLAKATKAAQIVGDVVAHYVKHASGKLGITFAVDIDAATEIAEAFRKAGVPAEVVSSKTDPTRRRDILRQFKRRQIMQLVNVDLFGEGFDLPAIECVSMARATKSFNLFKQQFGRALRLMDGKQWAIIIDHVGNVLEHGLPDARSEFTLGRPIPKAQREPDENLLPLRVCLGCTQQYSREKSRCPYPGCGHIPEPVSRSAPEYVDGDLQELDAATLAQMRGEADAVMGPCYAPRNVEPWVAKAIQNKHHDRAAAQQLLRDTMALWAGWRTHVGQTPSELQRTFFLTYGVDVLTAQSLGATEAYELRDRIQQRLTKNAVVPAQ